MKSVLAIAALVTCLFGAQSSRADTLTMNESARLEAGGTVVRPVTIDDDGDARLVGGVTYTILDASVAELVPLFDDEAAYREILPRTKDAKVVRDGAVRHVAMRTGNAMVEGVYTLFMRQASPTELRFWLDRRAPHDLEDAYGYFRFTALAPGHDGRPRTLLTYAIAIDIGAGILRDLFEERVRAASLTLPQALVGRLARDRAARDERRVARR